MNSRYLKSGRTSLLELAHGTVHLHDLTEQGEAIERGSLFECRTLSGSLEDPVEPEPIPSALIELLRDLEDQCERATVISGVSRHQCADDEGERQWMERTARIHVSLINQRNGVRCEIEQGGRSFDPAWIENLREVATALRDAESGRPDGSAAVLEPPVAATIVATLAASDASERLGSIIQRPRDGERDGRGYLLKERPLKAASTEGFGWFRPSYRVRPFRTPHSLDLDARSPANVLPKMRIIALSGAAQLDRDRLTVPSVVVTGGTQARLMTMEIDLDAHVLSVADESPIWFPVGAGAWGRRLVINS